MLFELIFYLQLFIYGLTFSPNNNYLIAVNLSDIYGYNGFSLLIDFGSSLGLWLGLSAISFLDMGIYIWQLRTKIF